MNFIQDLFNVFSRRNQLPPENFEDLIYKISGYFLKYFPAFEIVFTDNKNGLLGNLYWDGTKEECINNYSGYLDDCALFLSTLREGGELLVFVDQPSGDLDIYGFIPDTKQHSIATCPIEILEQSLPQIKEAYGLGDQTVNVRELNIEQFLQD